MRIWTLKFGFETFVFLHIIVPLRSLMLVKLFFLCTCLFLSLEGSFLLDALKIFPWSVQWKIFSLFHCARPQRTHSTSKSWGILFYYSLEHFLPSIFFFRRSYWQMGNFGGYLWVSPFFHPFCIVLERLPLVTILTPKLCFLLFRLTIELCNIHF